MGNEKTSENIFTYSKFTSQVYIMHNLLGLDLFLASFFQQMSFFKKQCFQYFEGLFFRNLKNE